MISINEIHTFVQFLKNQGQNIYHSPEQIDTAINNASLDLFRQEEKIFEQTQIVTDTLEPFKVFDDSFASPGPHTLPADYIRATNMAIKIIPVAKVVAAEDASTFCDPNFVDPNAALGDPHEREIDIITDSDWVKRQDNLIVGPTEDNPVARIKNGEFEVLPDSIDPILYYLREPVKGVWAYTLSVDGHSFIFDVGSSTDLDWSEISKNEIIEKTMSLLGIPIRDGMLIQFEQYQKRNNKE